VPLYILYCYTEQLQYFKFQNPNIIKRAVRFRTLHVRNWNEKFVKNYQILAIAKHLSC